MTKRPQSTYIPRVPQSLSSRWKWDPAIPSPPSECALHPGTEGGGGGGLHSRRRVREWVRPNSDDWRESLVLCLSVHMTQKSNDRRQITFRQVKKLQSWS
jgi:hypothetical protein